MHDRTVGTDEPVEQCALADVRAADQGNTRGRQLGRDPIVVVLELGLDRRCADIGDPRDHFVEQVTGAPTVQRADRQWIAETERHELPTITLAAVVVDLVGHEEHRRLDLAQPHRNRFVVVGQADGTVDHEHHEICCANRCLDLTADLGVEFAAGRQPATRIDHQERPAEPFGLDLFAVAGDARPVLDDGQLLADDPVEQRALADVGSPDDDDGRQRGSGDDDRLSDLDYWCGRCGRCGRRG